MKPWHALTGVLFWGSVLAAGGRKIQLTDRADGKLSNGSTISTSLSSSSSSSSSLSSSSSSSSSPISSSTSSWSSSITSPPFVPPSSFDLMDCPSPYTNYYLYNCYRPGSPDAGFDFRSPYNTTAYPFNIIPPNEYIATYCAALWTSTASVWLSTAAIETNEGGSNVFYQELNSYNMDGSAPGAFTWTAPGAPCCLNCTILGGSVQVMVWPTPAPTPAASTLINSNNYTFISPSIYAVFQSLAATDLCGQKGSIYIDKTLSFAPTDLSTARSMWAATDDWFDNMFCSGITDKWQNFDYRSDEAGKCEDVVTSWWTYDGEDDTTMYSDPADIPNPTAVPGNEEGIPPDPVTCTYNPCSPYLSVPPQIYSVDPAFRGCMDGIKAFLDPPQFLTPGNGLQPFSASPTSSSSSPLITTSSYSKSAVPGFQVDPIAVKTATSSYWSSSTQKADPPQPADPPQGSPKNDPPTSPTDPTDPGQGDPKTNGDSDPSDPSDPAPKNGPAAAPTAPVDPADPLPKSDPAAVPTTPAGNQATQTTKSASQGNPVVNPIPGQTTTQHVAPVATIAGQPITQDASSNFVIGTQTLAPGGPAVTISGTTYSLEPSGAAMVVDGTTIPIQAPSGLWISTASNSAVFVLVGTQILVPGASAVIIEGDTYSVASTGGAVVVDGSTEYLIGGQTLKAGGQAITVSGTVVSLELNGQNVVVAGSTEALSSFWAQNTGLVGFVESTSQGLGGIIATLGGFATPTSTPTPVGYTGPEYTGTATGGYQGPMFLGAAVGMSVDILLVGVVVGAGGLLVLML